ncbi:MAG TPA: hypothetical protein VFR34_10065, partial [Paracoccaceae bacterium]|nr:hypothetical protein [Paracoccaceae bacterium]
MEQALAEVELVPAHGAELARAQAVAVGEQDQRGVAVAVAAAAVAGGGREPRDLLGGQVLARPALGVAGPARRYCPV